LVSLFDQTRITAAEAVGKELRDCSRERTSSSCAGIGSIKRGQRPNYTLKVTFCSFGDVEGAMVALQTFRAAHHLVGTCYLGGAYQHPKPQSDGTRRRL
jgi:hypothetical protein